MYIKSTFKTIKRIMAMHITLSKYTAVYATQLQIHFMLSDLKANR